MKAIIVRRFGGPEVLEFATDVALPSVSGNQLRIKVKSAGVNPVDTYVRSGSFYASTLPYTPGKDGAGIVDECGTDVKKFKVGDRVYFRSNLTGSYAEYTTAGEDQVFKLQDSLSFSQGAALGIPYFTAYRALITKGRAMKGQSVLIHGASGGTGLACCQIAKHLGLRVFGTAGTDAGLELIGRHGVVHAFNHKRENYVDDIKKTSGERGIDIIVEMLAEANLEKDLELVSEEGKILIVGTRGKVEIYPRHILVKEVSILGVAVLRSSEEEFQEMGRFFDDGQNEGWIEPVIGREFGLEEAQSAHREVIEHKQGTYGKIVLKMEP